MAEPATLLVADDDPGLRESLERTLTREGYRVVLASDGRAALERVQAGGVDLIVTDLKMPGLTGLELLRAAKAILPYVDVILLTAFGTIEEAVKAMKDGAYDFLTFFFNDTATTEIYTLSLHDALPICSTVMAVVATAITVERLAPAGERVARATGAVRSEEHTSELQSRLHLVCRLLLEKKNVDHEADHRGARRRGPVDEPAGQRHALHDPAAAQEDAWLSRRTSWSPTTIRGCARASSARSPARGTAWWSPPTGRPRSSGCRAAASISCSRISRCPGFPASSCCARPRPSPPTST